jgi:hypothetical protein
MIYTFREFEPKNDVPDTCAMLWEYWLKVNGEDLSDEVEVEVLGVPVKMQRVEKTLYGYLAQGFKITLALHPEGWVVGFLIARRVCDVVLEVRHMWVEPSERESKVGAGLVHFMAQEHPIVELIFQSRNELPPEQMLKLTSGRRRVVYAGEKLTTWAMPWEAKNAVR